MTASAAALGVLRDGLPRVIRWFEFRPEASARVASLDGLSTGSVRPHDQILAVRYFTAEVKDDPDGLARQRAYLAALKAQCTKVEVVLGRYQTKKMTCRRCGSAWNSYEEKETDVNIAVALVADAAAPGWSRIIDGIRTKGPDRARGGRHGEPEQLAGRARPRDG